MQEITIDNSFQRLMLPLSNEERQQLEENLVADGCRDPLVVWLTGELVSPGESQYSGVCKGSGCKYEYNEVPASKWVLGDGRWECPLCDYGIAPVEHESILIDGHNRYEICTRLGIEFDVVEMEFDRREEAEDWIDKNQIGRRNATPDQMSLIRGRRYNRAEKRQGSRTDLTSHQNEEKLTTAEKLAKQHGVSKATIERDGKFAEAVEALGMESEVVSGEVDAPKAAIVEAAKPLIDAKKAHDKWEADAAKMPLTPPPEPLMPTAEDIQKAKAHVSNNSGQNEWYTPSEYIDAATEVFGIIDCDPASSAIANQIVQASVFYSKEQDGLSKRWMGNVWLNPPYAQPLISQFSEAVATKYTSGEIVAAIVLVNNATETTWFQRMAVSASAICFPKSRIRFLDPEGNPGAPLQGQAILYLGADPDRFTEEFNRFGFCVAVAEVSNG